MRFDKPVGIFLLWFPTAWALWLANQGFPPLHLLIYFALGTVLMRAAGCVVNDIADRNIDKHVKRTRLRPLTHGDVTLPEAITLLMVLLFMAFMVLLQLPASCFYYALAAVFITTLYPFCKRFIQTPQLVLGVAFCMGIPMAYAASGVMPDGAMLMLCLLSIAWVVSYDTMYAMVDREDDLRIGVKSTAILFSQYDVLIIMALQIFLHAIWFVLAFSLNFSLSFYLMWILGGTVLFYQQKQINTRSEQACFKAFLTNVRYGLTMWVALIWQYWLLS